MDSTTGGTQQGVRYAGFWMRLLAFLIDYGVTFILQFIVGFILGMVVQLVVLGSGGTTETIDPILMLLVMVIGIGVNWLYFALMESSGQQGTLGKMALGMTVTDNTGGRLTFARATGRYFAKYLSYFACVGFLIIAFMERKQGLHDLIAVTLVIKKR